MAARNVDHLDDRLLVIERIFRAPCERVFDAWTKPELLMLWYAPRGCSIHFEHLDVRPGGRFHSRVRNPEFGDCWIVGIYEEVVKPERLVFTMGIADSAGRRIASAQAGHDAAWPEETRVVVTLEALQGRTLLRLEQNVSEALAKKTGAHPSWLQMLEELDELLANQGREG